MNLLNHIAQHLIDVSYGHNWTEVNIQDTVNDIDFKEAVTRSTFSKNTIASLVHHLAYWNRVMVQRIHGIKVEIPESNGFDVPAINNEAGWQELIKDYMRSADELADAIKQVDKNKLELPILEGYSSVYKNIQGSVEHIHYHLGQIVMIKKAVKTRLGCDG